MRRAGSPTTHQPVVKAQEVQPLAPFNQMHDTGFGGLGLQPEIAQQSRQPLQGGFGLLP
jgi:hypothetical protein